MASLLRCYDRTVESDTFRFLLVGLATIRDQIAVHGESTVFWHSGSLTKTLPWYHKSHRGNFISISVIVVNFFSSSHPFNMPKPNKKNRYPHLLVLRTIVALENSDVKALKKVVAFCLGTTNQNSIGNVFRQLTNKGWVTCVKSALLSTDTGRTVAGDVPPLTAEKYHSAILSFLTKPEAAVFTTLADGAVWDRQVLKIASGKGRLTQESFNNLLSSLKKKQVDLVKEVNGRENIQLSTLALHLGPSRQPAATPRGNPIVDDSEDSENPNMAAV